MAVRFSNNKLFYANHCKVAVSIKNRMVIGLLKCAARPKEQIKRSARATFAVCCCKEM